MYGQVDGPGPGQRARSRRALIGVAITVVAVVALVGTLLVTGKLHLPTSPATAPTAAAAGSQAPVTASAQASAQPTASASTPAATKQSPSAQSAAPPPPPPPGTEAQAETKVRSLGYTPSPDSASHWNSSATLNVIVAILTGSADGHPLWAFFFVNGHYIGTDTGDPSAALDRGGRIDSNTVAIKYLLYVPADAMCCPSAGTATVRFHWDGSHLAPLDPIPPASGTGPNRRAA